jgi:hypothetical protein
MKLGAPPSARLFFAPRVGWHEPRRLSVFQLLTDLFLSRDGFSRAVKAATSNCPDSDLESWKRQGPPIHLAGGPSLTSPQRAGAPGPDFGTWETQGPPVHLQKLTSGCGTIEGEPGTSSHFSGNGPPPGSPARRGYSVFFCFYLWNCGPNNKSFIINNFRRQLPQNHTFRETAGLWNGPTTAPNRRFPAPMRPAAGC